MCYGRASGARGGPALLAANRCNSRTIDDAFAQVRDYDSHPPSKAQLLQRYGAIADLLATLREEREILDTLCDSDVARAPLFAEIAAAAGWGLALQSDVAARLNASCPEAARALPTVMLADAWLSLANVVNDAGGTVPSVFTNVIPKIRTRATAVGLVLPPWGEATAYWRDLVRDKAQIAVASCPSPAPLPSTGKVFANYSQMR